MSKLSKNVAISVITHFPLATTLREEIHLEAGIYGAEINKVRNIGLIGTTQFNDLQEQARLIILCQHAVAEKIYTLLYQKLELDSKENGIMYLRTIESCAAPLPLTSKEKEAAQA